MKIPEGIQDVFDKAECLYTSEQVEKALDKMAVDITEVLADTNPIILCVMVGGMVPLGHLLLRLAFPLEVDYVHATRYRGEIRGTELYWKVKPKSNLQGRTVLVVDDILDGGVTLASVLEHCSGEGAKQIFSAVLVDKKHKRVPEGLQRADFTGLMVEDHYVFGYGMDYKEYLRNAPGIYMVAPEHAS